jgi:hypothetical protein
MMLRSYGVTLSAQQSFIDALVFKSTGISQNQINKLGVLVPTTHTLNDSIDPSLRLLHAGA